MNHNLHILLGSNSPRRRELLAGLGFEFDVVRLNADESYPTTLQAGEIPLHIARAKAAAYTPNPSSCDKQTQQLLITADTIVWCEGQMLGKPKDEVDARRMLHLLSGRTHQVYTAVVVRPAVGEAVEFVDCTDVTFRVLTDEEIDYYIRQYRPFDKAGAYGIQEWIGYIGCTRLEGSYFNVMGFPVERVYRAIQRWIQM